MDLKELLGEELYKQIMAKAGDKKIIIDDGKMIPKSRFDDVNIQKNDLKEQVDKLNKTLKENTKDFEAMKKAAGTNEELKKQLEDYETKINTAQDDFGKTLTAKEQEWKEKEVNNRKSFTLREKLLMEHADPKYIDLLMKEVDLKNVTETDDGKLMGVDDVVKGVKTNYEKLFGKPQLKGPGVEGGSGGNPAGGNLEELAAKVRSGGGRTEDRLAYIKAKQEAEQTE